MSTLKDRIKKLLAMAASNSEHEAKIAMLKARTLMAQHKLTYAEVDPQISKIEERETRHAATKQRDYWKISLAETIASKYSCVALTERKHGSKTYHIVFTGYDKDLEICCEVYDFAAGFADNRIKDLYKALKDSGCDATTTRKMGNGYGFGFARGVRDAFKQQDEEQEFVALVLRIPDELQEQTDSLATVDTTPGKKSIDLGALAEGYKDGRNFSPNRIIA